MLERTSAQSAALAQELRNVVRQTEALVGALAEDRDEALIEVRNRVAGALGAAKQRLGELDEARQRLQSSVLESADTYARERPWTIVAIGMAAGLMLGAWLAPAAERDEH